MLALEVPQREFSERRAALRERARERGFDGLLIWSRGGPAVDYYGNVLYLTNHFAPISSAEPDTERWTGRAYSALILPVEGEPVLVVDLPEFEREAVDIEDVRAFMHVPEGVAAALRDTGLDHGRIGLVGRHVFLATHERAIRTELGGYLDWEPADELLDEMRSVKSEAELMLMREAAEVGCGWIATMMNAAVPGATEGTVAGEGLRFLAEHGGLPADIDIASGPTGHKLKSRAAIPSWDFQRVLEPGDLFHVDGWGSIGGYYTDTVRTTVVGGDPSPDQQRLIEAPIACINHLLGGIRAGVRCSEVARHGMAWLIDHGFADQWPTGENGHSPGEPVNHFDMWPYFGHGIGLGIEPPWLTLENDTVLEPNMVLAVEVYLALPGVGLAGFEENIVVRTDSEPENLTSGLRPKWWV